MRIEVGAVTDIGRARPSNEDAYLVDAPTYAVADGMGGHEGGEVASALALETLEELVDADDRPLAEVVREANRVVFERSLRDRTVAGMGTTLTAVVTEGSRLRLAHVGDSRAYLLREGALRRLTHDHTLVARMVTEGKLTEEEAAVHPQRSILTRALGVDPEVAVDEGEVEVRDGDRLLLCTDGLTGMLGEERIRELLAGTDDPQRVAESLVAEANEAGGFDNITVVVLEVHDDAGANDRSRGDEGAATPVAGGNPAGGGRASKGPAGVAVAEPLAEEGLRPGRPRGPFHEPDEEDQLDRPLRRRSLPARIAVLVGLPVLVLSVALVGSRLYVDTQWYVGVDEGNVAIFRGIPTEVGGLSLHHVVERTDLSADLAERTSLWRGKLQGGITVESRDEAEVVVEQLRADLETLAVGGEPEPSPDDGS